MAAAKDLICYCFRVSKKDIEKAIIDGNEEKLLASIKKQMKDPGCFCETANPSGKCCLGDFKAFSEKIISQK